MVYNYVHVTHIIILSGAYLEGLCEEIVTSAESAKQVLVKGYR